MGLFDEVTNPTYEGFSLMNLFNSNHVPKVPSPNAVTLGIRIPQMNFGGDTNIQSIGNRNGCSIEKCLLHLLMMEKDPITQFFAPNICIFL